jgi:hypothetical protein
MDQDIATRTETPQIVPSARWLAAGVLGGFASGALIGGLGGRVAMFILRVTSSPTLHGLDTDDGFTMGVVSGATMFLVFATAFLGALGGVIYLVVRPWLPERSRPVIVGVVAATVGGAAVIKPGGIDFTALEPLSLAVVMFIAIPAVYGVVMSVWIERLLRPGSILYRTRLWLAGLAIIGLAGVSGGFGLGLIAAIIAVWLIHWRWPSLSDLWRSAPVRWAGRALIVVATARALAELVGDVSEVL